MIKQLVVIVITIFSIQCYAQQGTSSPYSFYGIGSLKYKGTVENRSMGGIGVYLDSIHVNLRNPASYGGNNLENAFFENESRPVRFAVAGGNSSLNLQSSSASENTASTTFEYLAVSIPVGKFGFGFGLLPYSSVGYKLENFDDDTGEIENRFTGEGGLNKVFIGFGYQISKSLSAGVDINYNFGSIQNSAILYQYDEDGNRIQYQTREKDRSDLSGLNLNFGLAYKGNLNEKLELSATATFSPESQLSSVNKRTFSTITVNPFTGEEFEFNSIDGDLESEGLDETNLKLPYRLALGTGIGENRKWFIGAEYTFQNTSVFANPIFGNTNSEFENSSNIALGGFYIPDYNSFSSYFKRVVYRAGFNVGNTGLIINNEPINEFGISFGLGLPVGELFSNANIGIEYGQRGTTNQNLIKENFINVNISLSLNDRWFRKRKYN